ncbi:MAG: biopolymer transporter ExbD [Sandaracinaceae bacterium]|nr:biopolymer transporter ExbD [Sandaracinaceae bacterium]
MKRFGGGKARPAPAMNVTPLVDIVLVLLIIFMVVLPSMEQDAPVDLPSIFHVDEEPEGRTDPATVSITADAQLFLEQEALSRGELESRLRTLHANEPLRRLILRGDASLRYHDVRDVFALCQDIGFPGISLRVGQRGESDDSVAAPR